MSKIKLLACPFCGHSPNLTPHNGKIYIECSNYNCVVSPFVIADTEAEAYAKWNTRTKPIKRVKSRVTEKENRADS